MGNPHILLWFEAPLQSWGADSLFGRRDTLAFPTKSGVLGLLCSALGAGGPQRVFLAEFAALNQTVVSFARGRASHDGVGKLDREPLLRDFHMVGGGYDNQDPWANLLIPKTSSGGKPTKSGNALYGGTIRTYRYYLQDAAFAVVVEVPRDHVNAMTRSLQNPDWDIYLGRKTCVPTDFVYRGTFDTEKSALIAAQAIAQGKGRTEDFRVLTGASDEEETFTLHDVPVQFGEDKRYRDRQVTVIYAR